MKAVRANGTGPTGDGVIRLASDALVVLVGPAGAGKTTFARRSFAPTAILSSDAFRAIVADDEADQTATAAAFDLLDRAAVERLRRGLPTVVDATNLRADVRRDLVAHGRRFDRPVVAIAFDLPADACLAQNRLRPGRTVPAAVVARHLREMRRTIDSGALRRKGFDAVHVLRTPEDAAETVVEASSSTVVRDRRARRRSVGQDGAMSESTNQPAPTGTLPAASIGPKTDRTKIRRKPDRAVPDQIEAILRAGHVAHVGYIADGEPRVIPFLYGYEDGVVILHGAPGSSTLGRLRAGVRVAVTVTLLDALIASKDAENHSANYRSVVAYGTTRRITGLDEKRRLLEETTLRYWPGRTVGRDYVAATVAQLKAMEVIAVDIEEAAAKARTGGPLGPNDADESYPGTAGVYPLDGGTAG